MYYMLNLNYFIFKKVLKQILLCLRQPFLCINAHNDLFCLIAFDVIFTC